MAVPYKVKNFHIAEVLDADAIKRVHLDDAKGKDVAKEYWLVNDTRAPANASIVTDVSEGFNYAKNNHAKFKVSIDKGRMYLWFYLPTANGDDLRQFTGGEKA